MTKIQHTIFILINFIAPQRMKNCKETATTDNQQPHQNTEYIIDYTHRLGMRKVNSVYFLFF